MKSKTSEKKLDEIYDVIEVLMREGHWRFIDEFLDNLIIRMWRTDIDELLAYATATFPGKSNIPSRAAFISHCKAQFPNKSLWKDLD
jgi:hypothetical protein